MMTGDWCEYVHQSSLFPSGILLNEPKLLHFSGFISIAEKTDMLWQVFNQGTFSWQSGDYNFCLVITATAVEMYLHAIKIASVGSHTECVAEVCTMSLSYFSSHCAVRDVSVQWPYEKEPVSRGLWRTSNVALSLKNRRKHLWSTSSCFCSLQLSMLSALLRKVW